MNLDIKTANQCFSLRPGAENPKNAVFHVRSSIMRYMDVVVLVVVVVVEDVVEVDIEVVVGMDTEVVVELVVEDMVDVVDWGDGNAVVVAVVGLALVVTGYSVDVYPGGQMDVVV